MPHSWIGYFINLDRSSDRRATCEDQLRRCGLAHKYRRFPAVDGTRLPASRSRIHPTALGCFASHAAVMTQPNPTGGFVHILEDDTLIPASFGGHMERILRSGMLDQFDIVFTDIIITARGFDYQNLRRFRAAYDAAMAASPHVAFNTIDLRNFPFSGTRSYLVTPAGSDRVRTMVRRELETGPSLEIDLLISRETHAGRLRAGCIFPFLTSLHFDHSMRSTITPRNPASPESLARRMAQYMFFVDCDLSRVEATLAPLTAERSSDQRLNLLADVQRILIAP